MRATTSVTRPATGSRDISEVWHSFPPMTLLSFYVLLDFVERA